MIRYRRGSQWIIYNLFKYHGSTFPYTILIALPCAVASAVIQYNYPANVDGQGSLKLAFFETRDLGGIMSESQAWSGFSFLVGFLIVFRTSQAYGRFWEGCTASHQMRAEWFDACSSLISFCKASCASPEAIMHFKALLITLTSMLHAAALGALEAGDQNEPEGADNFLMADTYPLIDPGAVDEESIETIKNCECRVELLFEWIQQLVVENIETGVLAIPPPILSRSFQELANGMVAFHDAMKISHIPFPFPYAQSCDCLLVFHWILVPFITSQWVSNPLWAGIFTFIQVFILWSLNLIAMEIDNPFGQDHNDIDASKMQEEINKHLSLLLYSSTERTPRLTRLSNVYTSMSGNPLIERSPSRNSFVDLFKDEDEENEACASPRHVHSTLRGNSFQNWLPWSNQSPLTVSMQTTMSLLKRKSEPRAGSAGSAASIPSSVQSSPHSPVEDRGRRRQNSSDRSSRWEPLGNVAHSSSTVGLDSLARNLQTAMRPTDEESVCSPAPDEEPLDFQHDASSNISVVMIDADGAMSSGRENSQPAPPSPQPSRSEAQRDRRDREDSVDRGILASPTAGKKGSKQKVVMHICPRCDHDLVCRKGSGNAQHGPCANCGKVVQNIVEHSCDKCKSQFCRECIRPGTRRVLIRDASATSAEIFV